MVGLMSVVYNSKHRYKVVFCHLQCLRVVRWVDLCSNCLWLGLRVEFHSNLRYLSHHRLFLLLLHPGMVRQLLFGVPG